jgi:hypothetical protein
LGGKAHPSPADGRDDEEVGEVGEVGNKIDMRRFGRGLKKSRSVKRVRPTNAMNERVQQVEGDAVEQEMREIEELIPYVKSEELRMKLQEKYCELLKKLKKESEETESEDSESEAKPEAEKEEEKLYGIKKFKIDEAMIDKILKVNNVKVHEFFVHSADILPKYFENDEEMRKYIKNKCYVGLRVKAMFTKDGDEKEEEEDEYFVPHHHKRRYLAQSFEDLREIMLDQVPKVEGEIGEFVRNGSGYILSGIKSVKLEVTPFKPGIRKARGYIELYPWLRKRKAVVNIRSSDGMCF